MSVRSNQSNRTAKTLSWLTLGFVLTLWALFWGTVLAVLAGLHGAHAHVS